jgi:hypothetical protein
MKVVIARRFSNSALGSLELQDARLPDARGTSARSTAMSLTRSNGLAMSPSANRENAASGGASRHDSARYRLERATLSPVPASFKEEFSCPSA